MDSHDHGATWFLAQLKPNSHAIAQRNLQRQGFRTFLPMQEDTQRLQGRFVTRLRPFFPGYIFVALDVAAGDWRAVNSTSGITRLVCLGAEPTPVPQGLVAELMQRCDEQGRLQTPPDFQPGEQVILSRGPFADLLATIEAVAPDRRVFVLIEMMGAQTRVALRREGLRRP